MAHALHSTALVAAIPVLWSLAGAAAAAPTARAGRDFLAYPGEVVTLDGTASEETDGAAWRWVQIGGPTVALRDGDGPRPRFTLPAPGRYSFELVLRAGETASAPDVVEVIAVDPGAGDRLRETEGCATAAGGPGTGLAALAALGLAGLVGRRRQA